MTNHWDRYSKHWQLLRPPLRPNEEVIERVRGLVGNGALPHLLLGSTAEYSALGPGVIAIDMSLGMLGALWVAAAKPARSGIQGDWTQLPIRTSSIGHVLGDGSLNSVPFGSVLPRILDEVTRVLRPGGKLIARLFCKPAIAETRDAIKRDLAAGRIASFHDLKWRVAMAVDASAEPDVAVQDIRAAMLEMFPDTGRLCEQTGWRREEVATIEVYAGSPAIYNFPTEEVILGLVRTRFAKVELIRCGSYALAERCPLLVAEAAT